VNRLSRVRATAYAKLTLSLQVLGRRSDGYHEIEALTVSIGQPHDVVELTAVPHPGGVTMTVEGETEHVPDGMENLAARAAEDLMLRAGRSGHGVRMILRKRIPAGAGLGGGSADAAAALRLLAQANDLELDDPRLIDDCADARAADVHERRRGFDGDGFLQVADAQRGVDRRRRAHLQHDARLQVALESLE
jgi:4-diphosphocytidyl-2-C-methyl-D-erythritol kinase